MDYTFYFWHVLAHRVPFLWQLHKVHHFDIDMDASTALHFMLMKSEHAQHLCRECAEICEECASECERPRSVRKVNDRQALEVSELCANFGALENQLDAVALASAADLPSLLVGGPGCSIGHLLKTHVESINSVAGIVSEQLIPISNTVSTLHPACTGFEAGIHSSGVHSHSW